MPYKRHIMSCIMACCITLLPIPVLAASDIAPPKKPSFGGFHMKPILEPHLNARKPDAPANDEPRKIAPPQPRPEHSLGTLTMRPPSAPAPVTPPPATQPPAQPTLATPAPAIQPPTPEPEHLSAALSPAGLPYPLRKPATPTERTLFDSVIAAVSAPSAPAPTPAPIAEPTPIIIPPTPEPEPDAPQPDEPSTTQSDEPAQMLANADAEAADDDPDVIEIIAPSAPAKPIIDLEHNRTQLRISRFNDENQRMAGASAGSYSLGNTTNSRLPDGMSDIRIRPLSEAQGQSPIIIPGLQKAAIARAPDIPRSIDQTRPDEVILFFEEDSNRLEIGQMAIIHTDVIELLRRRPELKVDIVGYAETGVDTETLSKARALMLRDYLIRNKIDERRIKVTGRANKTKIEPRDRADLFFIR